MTLIKLKALKKLQMILSVLQVLFMIIIMCQNSMNCVEISEAEKLYSLSLIDLRNNLGFLIRLFIWQKIDLIKKEQERKLLQNQEKAVDYAFPQPKYAEALEKIQKQKNINVYKSSNLIEVNKNNRKATFQNMKTGEIQEIDFDLIHIVPPPKLPKFLQDSPQIVDQQGYLDIDEYTLRHKKYKNIWGIGDCSNIPTSKTMAAIFSQTPVVVDNLYHVLSGKGDQQLPSNYDGYTCCPIFVGNGKLMLIEYKYGYIANETFMAHQEIPSQFFYKLKKDFFPWAYWNLVPKGVWHGRKAILPAFTKAFTSI
ncbi:pyridine nucleotide-disulfide, putative [Ichthyophthirius multifiliis]|uniref:Pyridine nucleotide-disulfide, putative n=1 Tax=Ichthyophthirius multifiliis TaxID=5932 RepID=G0QLK0_ICHMU|nr:pyridine nucleotide-disulfide, putative [Ichthyophthirius multifiliis]EGR33907.1 pyridine nucleotide-disulfide, putative [Ichthyophthirius multifiliis]|eukprot:XP_004039211.1 pyridine nucleotide-disulfide, putative [Ichthyophthirius multifiliis]